MNGPRPRGKAAEALPAPSTAQRDPESTDSIGDEADERKRFAELQERARSRGYVLAQTSTGYMVRRGNQSWHTSGLETLARLLPRVGQRR